MTKMKEALNTLMAGFDALQAAIDEAASKDSQAETPEADAESGQEEKPVLAQSFSVGTAKANDKQWIVVELKSEDTPVKLFHPMQPDHARSVAQSLLALVDKLKEE